MRPTKLYVDYFVMPIRRTLAQDFLQSNVYKCRYVRTCMYYIDDVEVGRLKGCFLEQRQFVAKNTLYCDFYNLGFPFSKKKGENPINEVDYQ